MKRIYVVVALVVIAFASVSYFLRDSKSNKITAEQKIIVAKMSDILISFKESLTMVRNDKEGLWQVATLADNAKDKIDLFDQNFSQVNTINAGKDFFDSIISYCQQKSSGNKQIKSSGEYLFTSVEENAMAQEFTVSRNDLDEIVTKITKVYQAAFKPTKPTVVVVHVTQRPQIIDVSPSTNNSHSGSYVIADSDQKLLSESDLKNLSSFDLNLARNEIYARHGRMFLKKIYQDYFRNQSWYTGDPYYRDSRLSTIEHKNALVIKTYQYKYGLN